MTVERIDTGRGHKYTIDGEPAPGVTTILNAAIPKPALPYWAAGEVAEFVAESLVIVDGEFTHDAAPLLTAIEQQTRRPLKRGSRSDVVQRLKGVPWARRDAAANRGVQVHDLAARWITGADVDVPELLDPYVKAYAAWAERWEPVDELVERTIAHRDPHYCGTFDLCATLVDGRRWLLDIKTSGSGVYAEVALQLAGYRYAQTMLVDGDEQPMIDVDACGVIWLTELGHVFYVCDVGARQWQQFVRCCHTARYLDGWGKPDDVLREIS